MANERSGLQRGEGGVRRVSNGQRFWDDGGGSAWWTPLPPVSQQEEGLERHVEPCAAHTYPDPPSRGEEWGLERGEERCVAREMERSGATALHGSFTQIPDLGARSGVWNDMGSPAWWARGKETELRPCKGRLPRPTTNERGNDMGSTWWKQWLEAELRPYTGRLPRTPPRSEKRGLERPGEPLHGYPTSEPYAGR